MLKKILWAIVIVAILLTIPSLLERLKVEQANNTYELALPYSNIEEMIEKGFDSPHRAEEVLLQLKEAGLQSVSIEPMTLERLELKGVLGRVSKEYLGLEYPHLAAELPEHYGLYYEILADDPMVAKIKPVFDRELAFIAEQIATVPELDMEVRTLELEGHRYLFIPYRSGGVRAKSLGFDFEVVEELSHLGFSVIPRVPNNFDINGSVYDHFIAEELVALRQYGDKVLFLGTEVTGFPVPKYMNEMATLLKELDYQVLTIEFVDQDGLGNLLAFEGLNENVVRLHSIRAGKDNEDKLVHVNQAIRALNERNLRVIFFNALIQDPGASQFYRNPFEANKGLEGTTAFLANVRDHERNSFVLGQAEPYQELTLSTWKKLVVFLAGLALTALFMLEVARKLTIPVVAGLGLIMLAQIVTGHLLLLKAIVLFVALVGPIFAIVAVKNSTITNWSKLIGQFVISTAIAAVSAWFVVSILYGTEYLVKLDGFTGVKFLAIIPVFVVFIITSQKLIREMAGKPVLFWQVPIFAVVALFLYFYLGRTGNEGIALSFELVFRQWLEDTLAVRPRTTEFLIAFPLFVVGLYATMLKKKWAPLFYVFGALGFSSMVGTFTHLHSPLAVSLLRTVLGLSFGFAIGLVIVGCLYVCEKRIYPWLKARFIS